jgi:CcmD family protein
MLLTLILLLTQVDTLTQAYSDKWEGANANQSAFADLMTSNDMIFVVLGVSLIIWFVVLSYLVKTENTLSRIEKELHDSK